MSRLNIGDDAANLGTNSSYVAKQVTYNVNDESNNSDNSRTANDVVTRYNRESANAAATKLFTKIDSASLNKCVIAARNPNFILNRQKIGELAVEHGNIESISTERFFMNPHDFEQMSFIARSRLSNDRRIAKHGILVTDLETQLQSLYTTLGEAKKAVVEAHSLMNSAITSDEADVAQAWTKVSEATEFLRTTDIDHENMSKELTQATQDT
jgi:hypothetical protein